MSGGCLVGPVEQTSGAWGSVGQWGRLKGYEACLCFLVVSQVGRVVVPHVQRRGERDHRVAVLRLARVPAI